jgi:hypothetical protein
MSVALNVALSPLTTWGGGGGSSVGRRDDTFENASVPMTRAPSRLLKI